MKILSPVGNMESLYTAINNGADEVYLGINEFNARNNIDGFTTENLKDAVDFAHIFGVKVNLALNILFTDEEISVAIDVAVKAYNMGVDSFIVQDLGLISILRKHYPQIELHASTQMGIHNLEGVRFLEKLGIKRVVLARETPLSEIKSIKEDSDIEIEYFAHGALCVSFSGNCYLSSYLHNASGNRGRCKQLCRLPYTLNFKDKKIKSGYLLSAKDFDMTKRLKDLKDAGVDVIKIEGRARRPFYVGAITKVYRSILDGKEFDKEELLLAFNRGFTDGYFSGNGKIISDYQNHIGIYVGKVNKVQSGKRFNQIFFSSKTSISPKSSFKIFYNGEETGAVTAFDLTKDANGYSFTTTQKISVGSELRLIVDDKKENAILKEVKKKDIQISLSLQENKKINAKGNFNGKALFVEGAILQSAENCPILEKELQENFSKTQLFNVVLKIEKLEKVFIRKQDLNLFRRNVLDKVYRLLIQNDREEIKSKKIEIPNVTLNKFTNFQYVNNLDEEFIDKNIIFSPEEYTLEGVKRFVDKCKSQNKNFYLDAPNFALKEDIELIKNISKTLRIKIVANNLYALSIDLDCVVGAGLNVYNSFSAKELNLPFMTAEIESDNFYKFPFMTLRHCPIKNHVGGNCDHCKYKDGYCYVTSDKKKFYLKRKKLSTCTFYLV